MLRVHSGAYSPFARGKPGTRSGTGGFAQYAARKPMFNGLDLSKVTALHPTNMNWDFVKRLRDTVSVKLLVKGVVTREDAHLAAEHGVDGLVVRIMADAPKKRCARRSKVCLK